MEEAIVRGVAHDTSEAKLTVRGVPDQPGIAAALFEPLASQGVNVDMIVQNVSEAGVTDISFTVPIGQTEIAAEITAARVPEENCTVTTDAAIGRVSIVGAGMKSNPGVAATMFETLAANDINIEMISTSAIRISCVVGVDHVDAATQALHDAFDLSSG